MTRWRFLAGLFGVSAAANAQEGVLKSGPTYVCKTEVDPRDSGFHTERCRSKPKNGECPVCGTVAAPFSAKEYEEQYCAFRSDTDRADDPDDIKTCAPDAVKTIKVKPQDMVFIRCSFCSAAFYQDAEAAK
jgi:hypothetical protein